MVSQTTGTTTSYSYLGLTTDLSSETGSVNKSYTYTPGDLRLSQYTPSSGMTTNPRLLHI